MHLLTLPLDDSGLDLLSLARSIESLKRGEMIEVRLKYRYRLEAINNTFELLEEAVGRELKWRENGSSNSFIVWVYRPGEETL